MKPIGVMRRGGTTAQVYIFDHLGENSVADPSDAAASYSLYSSGLGQATGSGDWTWLVTGVNSDYAVRCTVNSGTLTSGTTGVWTTMTSDSSWSVSRTTVGIKTCTFTIEIRRTSDSVVIATNVITLTAEVT